jgi:hypothetical protein
MERVAAERSKQPTPVANKPANSRAYANSPAALPADKSEARKAYMRDLMRKKRAAVSSAQLKGAK